MTRPRSLQEGYATLRARVADGDPALNPSQLAERLRDALAHTSPGDPRPVTRLELPLGLDRAVEGGWFGRLRPAAVLVPIRCTANGPRLILTVRSQELSSHSGQISFPGGRADPEDVFPVGTALREANEEIGLADDAVEIIGFLDDYPTISRYRVTPVVGLVDENAEYHGESFEVGEVFEVPLSFLLQADNYKRRTFARLGLPYYEVRYKSWRIWGATAGMLWDLQEKFAAHGH